MLIMHNVWKNNQLGTNMMFTWHGVTEEIFLFVLSFFWYQKIWTSNIKFSLRLQIAKNIVNLPNMEGFPDTEFPEAAATFPAFLAFEANSRWYSSFSLEVMGRSNSYS